MALGGHEWDLEGHNFGTGAAREPSQQPGGGGGGGGVMDDFAFDATMGMHSGGNGGGAAAGGAHQAQAQGQADFSWEMIGLGLEEPLPTQETIDELHDIYFSKVHASIPMVHRYRYLAAMDLAPSQRPPVCLRYAIWTMACSVTDRYLDMRQLFYQRARKYLEADYMKGFGEHIVSVAHCQAHVILSFYEMKMMYFPRAWISAGSAVRLAQMWVLQEDDALPKIYQD